MAKNNKCENLTLKKKEQYTVVEENFLINISVRATAHLLLP